MICMPPCKLPRQRTGWACLMLVCHPRTFIACLMLPAAAASTAVLPCPAPRCAALPQIPWVDDLERIKAWEESRTGYPWWVGRRVGG